MYDSIEATEPIAHSLNHSLHLAQIASVGDQRNDLTITLLDFPDLFYHRGRWTIRPHFPVPLFTRREWSSRREDQARGRVGGEPMTERQTEAAEASCNQIDATCLERQFACVD